MLAAPFAGMRGTKVDGSWSGFADDLFIKDVLSDHKANAAKDVILNNAASLDHTLAEDQYKQNLRKLEIVPSIRRNGERRRLTPLVALERSKVEPGTRSHRARHSEPDAPSTVATKRKSSADYRRWRRTARHCEAFGSHAHPGVTDA